MPTNAGIQRRDLKDLAGAWKNDPGFDSAVSDQDVVDEQLWR